MLDLCSVTSAPLCLTSSTVSGLRRKPNRRQTIWRRWNQLRFHRSHHRYGVRETTVAIEGLKDLSKLNVTQLYAVYLGIARADWMWRRVAVYGVAEPPPGHASFRPLPYDVFEQRMKSAESVLRGDETLRGRLARQAAAYGVDVEAAIAGRAQAA